MHVKVQIKCREVERSLRKLDIQHLSLNRLLNPLCPVKEYQMDIQHLSFNRLLNPLCLVKKYQI